MKYQRKMIGIANEQMKQPCQIQIFDPACAERAHRFGIFRLYGCIDAVASISVKLQQNDGLLRIRPSVRHRSEEM